MKAFITDLDRTIIHSKNPGFTCVETYGNREITFKKMIFFLWAIKSFNIKIIEIIFEIAQIRKIAICPLLEISVTSPGTPNSNFPVHIANILTIVISRVNSVDVNKKIFLVFSFI